ncbi:site-specific integrase [Amedibacterium intestinale]|uniref:site-specific integrase n=1 Tax=Amedibacterium intestinale TaxID=2583452 RepID=UPI000E203060
MSSEQNVTAFLRQKRDYFHIILTYQNYDDSITKLSFSTSLKVRGNKKKAEMLMQKVRVEFVVPRTDEQLEMEKKRIKLIIKKFLTESDTIEEVTPLTESNKEEQKITKVQKPKGLHKDMLFSSYLVYWLEYVEKYTIDPNTYSTYRMNIVSKIAPYFENKVSTLSNLTITDIQEYYTQCIDGYKIGKKEYKPIKPATVKRRHANIRKALQYAVDINLIPKNPAVSVELPKIEKYVSSIYTKEEIDKLFDIVRGTKLEVPVTLAAFYGLRREEAIGLRWDAIDFEKKRITINHTVTEFMKDGKLRRNTKDSAKNTSSLRTFPLVEPIEKMLKRNRKIKYKENYAERIMQRNT